MKSLPDLFKGQPTVFHWHGDQFEIPLGCLDLLSSEANSNQAFSFGDQALGLQFHLEVTPKTLSEMVENGASELADAPYIQTAAEIKMSAGFATRCNVMMAYILKIWVDK